MYYRIKYTDGKYVYTYITYDERDTETTEKKTFVTLSGAMAYAETYHKFITDQIMQNKLLYDSWNFDSNELYYRFVDGYQLTFDTDGRWYVIKSGKRLPIKSGKASGLDNNGMFAADRALGIILGEVPALTPDGIFECAKYDFNTDENCCMNYEDYMDYYYNLTPQYIVEALRFYGDTTGK